MKKNSLLVFAAIYSLVVGLLYMVTAFVAPGMGGDSYADGFPIYFALSLSIIIPVVIMFKKPKFYAARGILCIDAFILVYGAVTSWTGLVVWQVPFAQQEIFQVTMAFQDLIGAACMIFVAFFWEGN